MCMPFRASEISLGTLFLGAHILPPLHAREELKRLIQAPRRNHDYRKDITAQLTPLHADFTLKTRDERYPIVLTHIVLLSHGMKEGLPLQVEYARPELC